MRSDVDPKVFLSEVFQLPYYELDGLGETATDERLTTIILDALPEEMNSTVRTQSVKDPDLGLEEIIGMSKTIFINHPEMSSVPKRSKASCRKVWSNAHEPGTDNVCESAMTLTCHYYCKKAGHKKKHCKELLGKSDKPSNVENGTKNGAHIIILIDIRMRITINSISRGKRGARITRKSGTHLDTSAITRDMVAVTLPLTVKLQKTRCNVTGCIKCDCNGKVESKTTEDDKPNNKPPGVGFSFAMCHPSLSQEADGFQLLVDSGSSKHFIDPELIHGVKSIMQDYTKRPGTTCYAVPHRVYC